MIKLLTWLTFFLSLVLPAQAYGSDVRILAGSNPNIQDMKNPSSGCKEKDPISRLRCTTCNSTHYRIRLADNDLCLWCNASAWQEGCMACKDSLTCLTCNTTHSNSNGLCFRRCNNTTDCVPRF